MSELSDRVYLREKGWDINEDNTFNAPHWLISDLKTAQAVRVQRAMDWYKEKNNILEMLANRYFMVKLQSAVIGALVVVVLALMGVFQ